MSIAKKLPERNSSTATCNNTLGPDIGNIILRWCYKEIRAGDESAFFDLLAEKKAELVQKNNSYNIKYLDIYSSAVKLTGGIGVFLFRGLIASITSGKHLSLIRCCPRRHGRGDNSVYKRLIYKLKTIITVLCGSINSPIAKASQDISVFSTFFGDQNIWSFAVTCCFRPFCFSYKGF